MQLVVYKSVPCDLVNLQNIPDQMISGMDADVLGRPIELQSAADARRKSWNNIVKFEAATLFSKGVTVKWEIWMAQLSPSVSVVGLFPSSSFKSPLLYSILNL